MAENEVLDFGHHERWKLSRRVLRDPARTLSEFVEVADDECREAVRRLPAALRKGPPLIILLRALQASITGLQEVVAAFTEKRLANVVIAAARCNPDGQPRSVAQTAAETMVETLVDQITMRAMKEKRFCSPEEQIALRDALTNKFAPYIAPICETIESSLRGAPIKQVKTFTARARRMLPAEVAGMSLVSVPPQERPHAH